MFLSAFTTATFSLTTLAQAAELPPLPNTVCPIMGKPANDKTDFVDFKGVRYAFCCAGCPDTFAKDPTKVITNERNKGKLLGFSLFDPISKKRITLNQAKGGFSDYNGVRYLFFTEENKKKFNTNPAEFSKSPPKESLVCPVMEEKTTYSRASGYADLNNARYYFCCDGCSVTFAKDPAKYAKQAEKHLVAATTGVKISPAEANKTGSCCDDGTVENKSTETGDKKSCCDGGGCKDGI